MSLLEECRLRGKSDLLKRNIKYMIYETKCKLDPNKVKQITGYMDERNRRRKKILRALRRRNSSYFFYYFLKFKILKLFSTG